MGRETGKLVGYVVARNAESVAVEDLQNFLNKRLPEYMAPVQFVFLETFPLTHNGKVDRRHCPLRARKILPRPATSSLPQTGAEKALAGIWTDLLTVERWE